MGRGGPLAVLAALGATCLGAPAVASAVTYCVHSPPACSGDATKTSIQDALDAAKAVPGRDLILVGPGSHAEGFNDESGNPVDIVGQGAGAGGTRVDLPDATFAALVSEPSSTVRDMTISQAHPNRAGVELAGSGDRLEILGSTDDTRALLLDGGATLTRSSVSNVHGTGVSVALGAQNVTVEDSVVAPADYAVINSGSLTLRRVRLAASIAGLNQQNGPSSRLEDVLITLMGSGPAATGVAFTPTLGDASVTASHLTVVGDGVHNQVGISVDEGAGFNATATVRDSVFRGLTRDLHRRSDTKVVQLAISYSDYSTAKTLNENLGGSGSLGGPGNVDNVDPLFVDPSAGDYRLRADSPLIEAGTPGPLAATESATDLAGNGRIRDANADCIFTRDMGAYEFQPPARNPVARAGAPAAARAYEAVAFDASASCDPDTGGALTYTWAFDDGASATGASVQHAFNRRGAHSGTVTVRSASGRTATAAATVMVRDDTRPAASGLAINPSTLVVADFGASIAATRGAKVRYRLSEPATVRFTVQRAGPGRKVKGRCVKPRRSNLGRRSCTRYTTLRGSFTHAGRAGPNSFRFTGRLRGRKLKPGRYRLVAVPTDLSGNRGKAIRRGFRVKR
jgi:hypothetical protein